MDGGTVIGEIGGSSSRWALVGAGEEVTILPTPEDGHPGFNPLSGDAGLFTKAMRTAMENLGPEFLEANTLHVYGAGCGSAARQQEMRGTLATLWPKAHIQVDSDLMAAGRGLHGDGPALVLILGTGMNAGHFDGRHLLQPMPSLGWILGDEGSGADIGRILIQDAFYRRMPDKVRSALFGADGPRLEETLQAVYRSPFPARTVAAHTGQLRALLDETYVRDVVVSRFHALADLLGTFFTPEQCATVHATGSVAWGFQELLSECLLDRGMTLTVVERDPLPGLVRYHRPA
jgi:glucosamine kinase